MKNNVSTQRWYKYNNFEKFAYCFVENFLLNLGIFGIDFLVEKEKINEKIVTEYHLSSFMMMKNNVSAQR